MVIASCSGEGGAALSRRNYGETVKHLAVRYGYQFAANYANFGDDPGKMPVDANMLVALMAPSPVLLQTGDKDLWSDPKGEFLSAVAAAPVFKLLGKQGLGTDKMPAPNESILHTIGYHMHEAGHGTVPGDYEVFRKFIEMQLNTR
jgi:hypothetical protein